MSNTRCHLRWTMTMSILRNAPSLTYCACKLHVVQHTFLCQLEGKLELHMKPNILKTSTSKFQVKWANERQNWAKKRNRRLEMVRSHKTHRLIALSLSIMNENILRCHAACVCVYIFLTLLRRHVVFGAAIRTSVTSSHVRAHCLHSICDWDCDCDCLCCQFMEFGCTSKSLRKIFNGNSANRFFVCYEFAISIHMKSILNILLFAIFITYYSLVIVFDIYALSVSKV